MKIREKLGLNMSDVMLLSFAVMVAIGTIGLIIYCILFPNNDKDCILVYNTKGEVIDIYTDIEDIVVKGDTVSFYYNGATHKLINQRVEIITDDDGK